MDYISFLVAVIIVTIVLVVGVITWVVIMRIGIPDSSRDIDTSNFPSQIPIWGPVQVIDDCRGYQFPPINSRTPGIPTFNPNIVDNLSYVPGGFECIWVDQMNEQPVSRTCIQGLCTGIDGSTYTQGQSELFYAACSASSESGQTTTNIIRCNGSLGLIAMNSGIHHPACIGSNDDLMNLTQCDLFDDSQYLIAELSNQFVARISQRQSGLYMSADVGTLRALFTQPENVINNGYVWIFIPGMNFKVGRFFAQSPPQIGYVGNLSSEVINNPSNYTSLFALRNFIISTNMLTLQALGSSVGLASWYFITLTSSNEQTEPGISISDQATKFIPINKLAAPDIL